jgi:hypothetical protein
MRFLTLVLAVLCMHRPLAAEAGAPAFPALKASDLNGVSVGLPRVLSGPCLVVVGFSHASGDACKAWQQHFCAAALSGEACPVFELVELESAPFFVPPMVRSGLRKQVPAALYGNVFIAREGQAALEAALGFDSSAADDPYLALLSAAGDLAWFGHGPWSQGRQDELSEALHLLRHGTEIRLGAAKAP